MKFVMILMLFILPIVLSAPQCKLKADYDFFQLTLSWPSTFCLQPKSFCKDSIKKPNKLHFNIHGLWPSSYTSRDVGYCCNEDYNSNSKTLNEFRNNLEEKWPSMRDDRYHGFWRYEFLKHGSCALDVPKLKGVKNYFSATLRLYDQLGIDDKFKEFKFIPKDNPSETYNAEELESKLQSAYGAKPKIRCLKTKKPEVGILEQISFCYDKALRLIDCRGKLDCGKNMIIPTYDTDLSAYKL